MKQAPIPSFFAPGPLLTSWEAFALAGQHLTREQMNRVTGARVLWADYRLLEHDLGPHLEQAFQRPLAMIDPTERQALIDGWLLDHAAYMSKTQTAQTVHNTPIPVSEEVVTGYRPPRYGRAALLAVDPFNDDHRLALLDVKGCGVSGAPPYLIKPLARANGLLTLPEALQELLMEQLAARVLQQAGSEVRPLPTYAVLDLGFEVRFTDGTPNQRAGLLVRRAHARPAFQWGEAPPGPKVAEQLLQVERHLRQFGLSTSACGAVQFKLENHRETLTITRDGAKITVRPKVAEQLKQLKSLASGPVIINGVNVQVDHQPQVAEPGLQILDFGRYRFKASFEDVLLASHQRDFEELDGVLVEPGDPRYVQPEAERSLAAIMASPEGRRLSELMAGSAGPIEREAFGSGFSAFLRKAEQQLKSSVEPDS